MQKLNVCKNDIKNSHLAGVEPAGDADNSSIPFSEWEGIFQSKSYMNFPIMLLQHMATDKAITAKCYVLWQQLYSKAFWNEGSISISKAEIADQYKMSETSVKEYLKKLVEAGYLKVTRQKSNKGYAPSKLTLCLPKKLVELLNNTSNINVEEGLV